jgi:hypothetical protein
VAKVPRLLNASESGVDPRIDGTADVGRDGVADGAREAAVVDVRPDGMNGWAGFTCCRGRVNDMGDINEELLGCFLLSCEAGMKSCCSCCLC